MNINAINLDYILQVGRQIYHFVEYGNFEDGGVKYYRGGMVSLGRGGIFTVNKLQN